MIHGVFGKLGAGKGLLVMDIIAKELIDGFRDIVTNVPLRIVPWVNGQGIPQIGLRAYLLEKLHPLGEDETDEILKRVLVNEDIDAGGDLFMWRRDGETGEWFKLSVTKNDDKGRPERFDASEIKKRNCAPCLVVTDEAWQFYPNNGGWARVPLLPFYARQQRKLRDEWFIVTQHPSDVDMVLWNIAQDFWVCRNHGMERMGIFRQPAMFRVIVYLTNPAKGNAIRSHEIYRTLDKRLSQCYDTTAGVGITGGFKGDSNQKKSGLHIGWALFGVLLLVGCLAFVPHLLGKGASAYISHATAKPKSAAQWAGLPPANVSHTANAQAATATQCTTAVTDNAVTTNEVTCSGWMHVGGGYSVFLSDGTTWRTDAGEVDYIRPREVSLHGKVYRVVARPAFTQYNPSQPDEADVPVGASQPVNQASVTVIGRPRNVTSVSHPSIAQLMAK